jgi:hypothetical protein
MAGVPLQIFQPRSRNRRLYSIGIFLPYASPPKSPFRSIHIHHRRAIRAAPLPNFYLPSEP